MTALLQGKKHPGVERRNSALNDGSYFLVCLSAFRQLVLRYLHAWTRYVHNHERFYRASSTNPTKHSQLGHLTRRTYIFTFTIRHWMLAIQLCIKQLDGQCHYLSYKNYELVKKHHLRIRHATQRSWQVLVWNVLGLVQRIQYYLNVQINLIWFLNYFWQ